MESYEPPQVGAVREPPLLSLIMPKKANLTLVQLDLSHRDQTAFYVIAGGLLIVLGAAELWLSFL